MLLVLNHCSIHRETLSASLLLLEKPDFVIRAIDFYFVEFVSSMEGLLKLANYMDNF